MGIQSTASITREDALDRIEFIHHLIITKSYKDLVDNSFETDYSVEKYVNEYIPIDIDRIHKWTDEMLGNQMDEPYFRYSQFDNYIVFGEFW